MHKYLKGIQFDELIIWENDNYIVVNKPPYLSTLEDRNDPIDLLMLGRTYHPDVQVCHRIDKETSGILVMAKNPEAYRHFSIQLEKRKVKKVYHAVIDGLHEFDNLEADEPIYSTNQKSRIDFRNGKPSLTLVSTLALFKNHTLVKCFPVTGRLHQIRIHLSHHQAPISGDPIYGGAPILLSEIKKKFNLGKWEEEKPLIQRVALHAHQIAFQDFEPKNDEVIEIEAPYPKDFAVLLKQLKKYSR